MGNARVKTIVASTLLAGSVLWLALFFHSSPPPPEKKAHEAVGRVLAEEAGKLLGAGGRITVLARDTKVFVNPAADSELKGFATAAQELKLPVAGTNLVQLDPLRAVRVPPGDFFTLLGKLYEGDVVVSFLGPPVLSAEQRAKVADKKVRIAAFCPGDLPRQVNLKELFDQNLLHAVVISRAMPLAGRPETDDARAWFRQLHQLITPAELSELPVLDRAR